MIWIETERDGSYLCGNATHINFPYRHGGIDDAIMWANRAVKHSGNREGDVIVFRQCANTLADGPVVHRCTVERGSFNTLQLVNL